MSKVGNERADAPRQHETLGFLLRELYEALQRDVYSAAATDGHPGIRDVHSPVLRQLTPAGVRVSDVARRSGYAKQSIAYVVEDLQSLGYVRVEPDPDDGRAKRIRLTARGEALQAALVAHSRAAEKRLARALGSAAVSGLRSTLVAAVAATRRSEPGGVSDEPRTSRVRRAASARPRSAPRAPPTCP